MRWSGLRFGGFRQGEAVEGESRNARGDSRGSFVDELLQGLDAVLGEAGQS
jgi:hypothetical protein